jgi:membrane protein YqaA with SNARE-associated domain
MKKSIAFISVFISLIIIALMIYGLMNVETLGEEVTSQIQDYGVPALFIISILLDLIPQIISPVAAMVMAVVMGVNIYSAIIATILGSTIGSIIGFALGKKYMFKAVNAMASKKSVNRLTDLTNRYGKIAVPIAAISPVPYLPVLLGAINFSNKNFIIFGLIPRALSIIILSSIIYLF